MRVVDARGRPCPKPVLMTKEALESAAEGENIRILVDNPAARDNVLRFLSSRGEEGNSVEEKGGVFVIDVRVGRKTKKKPEEETIAGIASCSIPRTSQKTGSLLLVSSDVVGRGDRELGMVLIKSAFAALADVETRPKTIIFMNTGVKLATQDSPLLEELRRLQELGTEILVCGTCLDWFGLKDKLSVGTISNMFTILEKVFSANSVVSF